jgi:phospholipid transport system substrate-binding protein
VLFVEVAAFAGKPVEQVRATADRIMALLSDPKLQGEGKRGEKLRLIREELEECFNWDTICRSCLGRHWSKFSREQQKEFTNLFKQFLEGTYIGQIEPYYNELDRIEYQGERIVDNQFASVKTVVVTKQKIEHPVEYRLEKAGASQWRVYDVVIEGVSLVKNYRTQFDEMIGRSSPDGLLNELRSKPLLETQKPVPAAP